MRNDRRKALLKTKIKKLSELERISRYLQGKGKSIVFTNGCFDLLHYGHVKYLEEAKRKGDILIVGVNSDSSVKKIKGDKRPITGEKARSSVIAAIESVDYVVLFKEETPLRTIKSLKPDILVKGADWKKNNIVGADFIKGYGGKVCTVKLAKGHSTTGIIKKIAKTF